MAMFIVDR